MTTEVKRETVALHWVSAEVAVITLDRPDAANSISLQLADDLQAAIEAVRFSEAAKVLVVTGAGRFFCAGADLKERDQPPSWIWRVRAAIDHLQTMEQLVIAAINGPCMGGGMEIALACDFRVAALSAEIGLPEITFGALPAAGGPQRLARLVGPARAKYLVCSGRRLPSEEAQRIGVIDEVVEDGESVNRAVDLARNLAVHARYALRTAKHVVDAGLDLPLAAALQAAYRAIDGMATPAERAAEVERAMAVSETYRRMFRDTSEPGR